MSKEILDLIIDSNNFTVGGGSASALAGAMAAGLVGMVARLSLKKPVGLSEMEYKKIIKEADELALKLQEGAAKDTEAYLLIKNAYALKKETEEEKSIRAKAISDAGVAAASVPRDNALMCKRVNELACNLVDCSNPAASSDLACGIFLSDTGVEGCILNVEANLSLIKDEEIIQQMKDSIENLK